MRSYTPYTPKKGSINMTYFINIHSFVNRTLNPDTFNDY